MADVNTLHDHQPTRWRIGIGLLALFAAYLLLASSSTLWDRDEPRFARCTVEMAESGDYLVPRFNNELRPDKPAGIYWLMSVGYKALGFNEVAFRLPSILGITLAAFLTYLMGKRIFNARVGYRAMLFYGSALIVAYMATASTADGAMNGMITLAIWCFVEITYGRSKLPLFILMTAALAMAQLIKGPVGVVIPVISMLGMGVFGWRAGAFKFNKTIWLGVGAAALISFGAFAAWGIPANIASDGELMKLGLGKHVGERAITPQENHGGTGLKYVLWLPFYFVVVLIAFAPWSMHLAGGMSSLLRKTLGEPQQRAMLWGYVVPTFVMMSLVATKLPHYILPIFPGLALLCAAAIDASQCDKLHANDKWWMRRTAFVIAPVNLAGAAAAAVVGWVMPGGEGLRLPGALLGATVLGFGAWQAISLHRGRMLQASRASMTCLPIALVIACVLLLPELEKAIKPSKPLADKVIEAGLATDTSIMLCGFNEPSLVFYLNRPPDQPVGFISDPEKIMQWASVDEPGVLIITRKRLDRVEEAQGELNLKLLFESSALQYSDNAAESQLLALVRGSKPGKE